MEETPRIPTTSAAPMARAGVWSAVLLVAIALLLPPFPGEAEAVAKLRANLLPIPAYLLSALWCWWPVRRSPRPRLWSPHLIALGCLTMAAADGVWSWLEWKGLEPFPSSADYFYLAVIPCFLGGVLLFPTRPLPAVARSRMVLDALIVLSAVFAFSWHHILGPTLLQNQKLSLEARVVGMALPAGDLLLCGCLVALVLRGTQRRLRPTLALAGAGLFVLMLVDSLFLALSLKGTYVSGGLLDVCWPMATLLMGLSGRHLVLEAPELRESESESEASDGVPGMAVVRALVPYTLLPLVGALFFSVVRGVEGRGPLAMGVYVGGAALVLLVLLRQYLFVVENLRLMDQIRRDGAKMARLHGELRAAQGEVVHAAKMASLGTLSAGIAHELNQPVAIVRGVAQQMRAEPDLPPLALEDLALIETQTGRMMRIIAHLRTFCRTTGHAVEEVRLHDVVRDSLTLVGAQMRSHGVDLRLELDPSDPLVRVNANELEQVFLNLIVNARDALEGGAQPSLVISSWIDGDQARVSFADNGPGVPDDALERVFEPFFTTKEVGRGTGLGLSISRNLMEKNRGTLEVRNDRGAVFTVTLPLAEPVALPAAA